MFTDQVAQAIITMAKKHGIESACLLALVEVETGGKPFEQDGRTPQLLYERHVAFKEAAKAGCQTEFVKANLAIPHWSKSTQYQDERSSGQRLALLAKARSINEEVADRSCSWGLGQTMGFLAEELHFGSARELVDHQTGSIDGQLDCLIGELNKSHLIEPLNAHDWPHVARIYNGSAYAENQYDVKLADAYKRWARKAVPVEMRSIAPDEQSLSVTQIRDIQSELLNLGYHEVGMADGEWGSRTSGAIAAFQSHEGLPVTGQYGPNVQAALAAALARAVPPARGEATADDLRSAGSRTIAHADKASMLGKLTQWAGLGGAASAGAEQVGLLDTAQGAVDQAGRLRGLFDGLTDALSWASAHWWLFALGLGATAVYFAEQTVAARLDDHRTGRHAGPQGD